MATSGYAHIDAATGKVLASELPAIGTGTVTDVSVVTANGVSGSVATSTTTPAITLTLGNITPTSVAAAGALSGTSGTFTARIHGASAGVTAANDLTLGAANQNIVSGNTTINALITTGWGAGDKVTLIFTGTPTVKHNTAGGAGTAVMLLSGSTDFVAAVDSVLGFEFDGTSWQETFRKAA